MLYSLTNAISFFIYFCILILLIYRLNFLSSLIDQKTQRQTGRQAQLSNIAAARAVADIIRTTLGPRSMLKVIHNILSSVIPWHESNVKVMFIQSQLSNAIV